MFKKILLLLGLSLITNHAFSKVQNEGDDVIVIKASFENLEEKTDYSSSILASIDGRTLTIVFTENLGNVAIEITNAFGAVMSFASLETPIGYQFFITNAGHYIVNFTLPNGDEYYGEFDAYD